MHVIHRSLAGIRTKKAESDEIITSIVTDILSVCVCVCV
jgi:hypothetical protein